MAHKIFPTEANVGAATGSLESRAVTEAKWRRSLSAMNSRSRVLSGLTYTGNTGLFAEFAAGTAVINGYYVEVDAFSESVGASLSNRTIAIQITPAGDLDKTGVTGDDYDNATDFSDGLPICQVDTDGTDVTANRDMRDLIGGFLSGELTNDVSPTILCGFRPYECHWWIKTTSGGDTGKYSWGYESRDAGGGWKATQLTGVADTGSTAVTFGEYHVTIATVHNAGLTSVGGYTIRGY